MSGSIHIVPCLKRFCLQISISLHQISSWGGSPSSAHVLRVQRSKLKWQLHSFWVLLLSLPTALTSSKIFTNSLHLCKSQFPAWQLHNITEFTQYRRSAVEFYLWTLPCLGQRCHRWQTPSKRPTSNLPPGITGKAVAGSVPLHLLCSNGELEYTKPAGCALKAAEGLMIWIGKQVTQVGEVQSNQSPSSRSVCLLQEIPP